MSIGRLYILDVLPTNGQLTFSGNGTVKDKSRPVIDEWPRALVFTKPCAGERENTAIFYLRTHSDPDRYPLQVCSVTIEGSDASLFEIKRGRNGNFILNPGDAETYEINSTLTDGHHQAELVVRSNAGILRIPLTAWIGSASISGLPDSFVLDGIESELKKVCGYSGADEVKHTFLIENSGPGALRICNIEILNSTGGDWWFDRDLWHKGIRADSVLLPGARRALTVTFRATTLDVFETAILKLITSEGIVAVKLEGRVQTRTENDSYIVNIPPEHLARFGLCITRDEIDAYMFELEYLLRDPDPLKKLNPHLPECDPRYLSCLPFMELSFKGLEPGSKFKLELDGEQSAFFTDFSSTLGVVFPILTDREVRIKLESSGLIDSRVRIRMSHWQLSLVNTWFSDLPTLDVSVAIDRVVTLGSKTLQAHFVSENGAVETVEEKELDWQPTSLASLDKLLILSGDRGLEVVTLTGDTFNSVAQVEMTSARFILPISKNADLDTRLRQGRYAYLVGTNMITLLDFTNPARPRESQQVKTRIEPITGFMSGSKLMLAGSEYVEVFQLTQEGKPESLGSLELTGITSIFGSSEKMFAIDKEGMVHIIGLSNKGLELLGVMQNIHSKLLPRGRIHILGDKLVSGRMDRKGFNLYKIQKGLYTKPAGE